MRILSQTNDMQGYHGTIGTPTNMYDYRGGISSAIIVTGAEKQNCFYAEQ